MQSGFNPFGLADIGRFAKPSFGDLDGDGFTFFGNTYTELYISSNGQRCGPRRRPAGRLP